jgi:hypothetical protein
VPMAGHSNPNLLPVVAANLEAVELWLNWSG